MNWRSWLPVIVGAFTFIALGVYIARNLSVTSDITHFLADGEDRQLSAIVRELSQSDLARTMLLTVGAVDTERAVRGADALARELSREPSIAWVRAGIDEASQAAVYDLYFPRRFYFLGDALMAGGLDDERLQDKTRRLKAELLSPVGALVRQIAARDPLLLFPALLSRFDAARGSALRIVDGHMLSADGLHCILFLGTRAPAFENEQQAQVLTAIDHAFARVNGAQGGELHLESTGANRFAVSAATSIRADIQRVSLVSTIGLVLLFRFAFGSFRYVLLGMIPLLAGMLAAIAVSLALFGRLHGITLAFGSSLIGVGIDYPEHYFSHHTLRPHPEGPRAGLLRIWPGLVLGALTTMAGLVGLAWTSFPGLREIAVFSTVGLASSLLATRWLLPPFLPQQPKPVFLLQRASRWLGRSMQRLDAKRPPRLLLVLALVLCASGIPKVRWNDDVSTLTTADPALIAEDSRVRTRVGGGDPGRFIVALGDTEEEALARNDQVAAALAIATRQGELGGFQSLHEFLSSASMQERSRRALTEDPSLIARLSAALTAEGFAPAAFEPFRDELLAAPAAPLTFDDLLGSPLADLVRPFRVKVDERVGIITPLNGVRDTASLKARLAGIPEVHYLDQGALLESAYGRFRERTVELVLVGILVIFGIIHARYRRLRLSLAALLPAIIASGVTLSVLAWCGTPLNLLHLVGILLVLSMGADYGIFMVESRGHPEELGATLLSLVVATTTTILSFGLLGLSANPALAALGTTAGLGVLSSLVLAPAALLLLRVSEES